MLINNLIIIYQFFINNNHNNLDFQLHLLQKFLLMYSLLFYLSYYYIFLALLFFGFTIVYFATKICFDEAKDKHLSKFNPLLLLLI